MSDEDDLKKVPLGIDMEQVDKVCDLIRKRGDAFKVWMEISLKGLEAKREVDLISFELERQIEFMRRDKP